MHFKLFSKLSRPTLTLRHKEYVDHTLKTHNSTSFLILVHQPRAAVQLCHLSDLPHLDRTIHHLLSIMGVCVTSWSRNWPYCMSSMLCLEFSEWCDGITIMLTTRADGSSLLSVARRGSRRPGDDRDGGVRGTRGPCCRGLIGHPRGSWRHNGIGMINSAAVWSLSELLRLQ